MSVENMNLWDAVEKTDPKHTKSFNKKGFKGTATNTAYLVRKATKRWGPMGIAWGLRIDDEQYVEGASLDEHSRETIHVLRATLWFTEGDKRGEVTHYGQTTFVGKDSRGVWTDEEAPKKSLTDVLAKCLSMLGFSADIFLGLFDDNKYVNQRRQEEAQKPATPPDVPALIAAATTCKTLSAVVADHLTTATKPLFAARMVVLGKSAMAKADSVAGVAKVGAYLAGREYLSAEQLAELGEAQQAREKELEGGGTDG